MGPQLWREGCRLEVGQVLGPVAGPTEAEGDVEDAAEGHAGRARDYTVLGDSVKTNLFGAQMQVIGRTIRINNVPFRVIGTLAAKGSDPRGRDQDDMVFVPEWST